MRISLFIHLFHVFNFQGAQFSNVCLVQMSVQCDNPWFTSELLEWRGQPTADKIWVCYDWTTSLYEGLFQSLVGLSMYMYLVCVCHVFRHLCIQNPNPNMLTLQHLFRLLGNSALGIG